MPVANDDPAIFNRTLVFSRAARARGFKVKALKLFGTQTTNFFSLKISGRKMFFEGLPTLPVGHVPAVDVDDKLVLKRILEANNFPHAPGQSFRRLKPALDFARRLGWPLVVKPLAGTLSRHTTLDIRSEEQLKEAIRVARLISRDFLVERFVSGHVFRVTLVGNEFVAACWRERPNVIGDGRCPLGELIEQKNAHPWRGERGEKNKTLHKIKAPKSGIDLASVPRQGGKVYLHEKVILAAGADIHEVTPVVHPANRQMFEKLAKLCQVPVIGFDFIAQDMARPFNEQLCAVIEANSMPFIDMHHYPVTGEPQDVAGRIVAHVLAKVSRQQI